MNTLHPEPRGHAGRPLAPTDLRVVELPLLLPEAHLAALEVAARGWGLTPAELVRYVIRDFLRREAGASARG